jgi:hypothetical protein
MFDKTMQKSEVFKLVLLEGRNGGIFAPDDDGRMEVYNTDWGSEK